MAQKKVATAEQKAALKNIVSELNTSDANEVLAQLTATAKKVQPKTYSLVSLERPRRVVVEDCTDKVKLDRGVLYFDGQVCPEGIVVAGDDECFVQERVA